MINRNFKGLLYPLALILHLFTNIRTILYRLNIFNQHNLHVPVISVGNLSMGGSGKTPLTYWIARFYEDHKLKPLILTRGYKSAVENSVGVLSHQFILANPESCGDEPQMLFNKLQNTSLIVGKNRIDNFKKFQSKIKFDLVILDDGFQHRSILRDLNIVLFDATETEKSLRLFPVGGLRESLSNMREADFIFFTKVNQVNKENFHELKRMIYPYVSAHTEFGEISYQTIELRDSFNHRIETSNLLNKKCIAIAGLAKPDSFFTSVESLGFEILEKMTFPDHHKFTLDEINQLSFMASKLSAPVIMSEKDMVKISGITKDARFWQLVLDIEILSGKEKFEERLSSLLQS